MDLAALLHKQEVAAEEEARLMDLMSDDSEVDEDDLRPTSSVGSTDELELLRVIADRLSVLNSTLIGVNLPKGKKPPKVHPYPRPVSALQVLRRQKEREDVHGMLRDIGVIDSD